MKKEIVIAFDEYADKSDLTKQDKALVQEAENALAKAYAPYSDFNVAAAALLENGAIISAANQENASYPAGICAERNLLAAISAMHPKVAINTMAITYKPEHGKSDHPISPCGICRQSIAEYQARQNNPIRIILAGMQGSIYIMNSIDSLLPLSFTAKELQQ